MLLLCGANVFAQNAGVDMEAVRSRINNTVDSQIKAVQAVAQADVNQVAASLKKSMDKRFLSSMERDFGISLEELARNMAYIRSKHADWKPQRIILYSDCYYFVSRATAEGLPITWEGSGRAVIFPASDNRRGAFVPGIIFRANGETAIINVTNTSKCYVDVLGKQELPSRVFWSAGLSL